MGGIGQHVLGLGHLQAAGAAGHPRPPLIEREHASGLMALVAMGFSPDIAAAALARHGGDRLRALDELLTGGSEAALGWHVAADSPAEGSSQKSSASSNSAAPPPPPVPPPDEHRTWGGRAAKAALCLVCLEEPGASLICCGQRFCERCMREYLETRVRDHEVLTMKCPGHGCVVDLPARQVRSVLSASWLERYEHALASERLARDPDTRWCPNAECGGVCGPWSPYPPPAPLLHLAGVWLLAISLVVMAGALPIRAPEVAEVLGLSQSLSCLAFVASGAGVVAALRRRFRYRGPSRKASCQKCLSQVCFDCREAWHPARTCADMAVTAVAEWSTSRDCGQCPSCMAFIERVDGCNHMTCRCGHEFCWLCGHVYGVCGCQLYGGQRRSDYSYQIGVTATSRASAILRVLEAQAVQYLVVVGMFLQLAMVISVDNPHAFAFFNSTIPSDASLNESGAEAMRSNASDGDPDSIVLVVPPLALQLLPLQVVLGLATLAVSRDEDLRAVTIRMRGRCRNRWTRGCCKALPCFLPVTLPHVLAFWIALAPHMADYPEALGYFRMCLQVTYFLAATTANVFVWSAMVLRVVVLTHGRHSRELLQMGSKSRRLLFEAVFWTSFISAFATAHSGSRTAWARSTKSDVVVEDFPLWANPLTWIWGAWPPACAVCAVFALHVYRTLRAHCDLATWTPHTLPSWTATVIVRGYLYVGAPAIFALAFDSMCPWLHRVPQWRLIVQAMELSLVAFLALGVGASGMPIGQVARRLGHWLVSAHRSHLEWVSRAVRRNATASTSRFLCLFCLSFASMPVLCAATGVMLMATAAPLWLLQRALGSPVEIAAVHRAAVIATSPAALLLSVPLPQCARPVALS